MHQLRRHSLAITLLLLLVFLGAIPAQALVQPRIFAWRLRLKKFLSPEVYAQTLEIASSLPASTSPEEFERLGQELSGKYHPATLSTAIAIHTLLRHDSQLNVADKRWYQCKVAIGCCEKYLERLEKQLHESRIDSDAAFWGVTYEPLPEALNDDYWLELVQLPSFDCYTSRQRLQDYAQNVREQMERLKTLKEQLLQDYRDLDATGKDMRCYTLEQCDNLNPETCCPYIGEKPSVTIIP